jgi:hypothetical protein
MRVGFSILCRMGRLLGTLLRWCLVPFLLLLAWAMLGGFARPAYHALSLGLWLWGAAGFAFRAAFRLLWNRFGRDDPLEFIDTLEHELTHALMGYLTFCPPVSLSATLKSGGEVELRGANPLAVLAPYFLPLWCLLEALLGLAIKPGLQQAWNQGLLFLAGWFLWRLALEFRWRQTDLHAYGFLFSAVFVANLLVLSAALLLCVRGIADWRWLAEAGKQTALEFSRVLGLVRIKSGF